jgi:hypothetical protein
VYSDNAITNGFYSYFTADRYTTYLTGEAGYNKGAFANIRAENIFIENYQRADASDAVKERYLGEVLFFKAWDYFDKVKIWGEVPWLSQSLQTNDDAVLSAPKTPRAELMDSIVACLDKAIAYLPEKGKEDNNRINKQMALFLKARVGLYEGTFRKYHNTGLDAEKFLRLSANASEDLLGVYALVETGDLSTRYFDLFSTDSYANNPEVILWREYSTELTAGAAFSRYFSQNNRHQFGATRSLVDEYLCIDGKTIEESPEFQGKDNLPTEFENRDPRLSQTIANFGTFNITKRELTIQGAENAPYPNIPGTSGNKAPTGYRVAKWWYDNPEDWDAVTNGQQAGLMWRYAEVLLNYAEAKYELGELTQGILDQTINKLRDRVEMPHLKIGQEPVDHRLDGIYTNKVGYSIAPILREIRRERRVEMAFENTRWDDIVRWKAGKLIEEGMVGMKFDPSEYPSTSALSKLVVGKDIYLTSEGYIDPYQISFPEGYKWDDRMYLYPFPISQFLLNPQLEQNPGWRRE